ncbi:MAG TPA: hypothetical protein VGE74_28225 [Gemmata sp.]
MVTFDDLAAAVVSRCSGSSAFTTAIPGGAWLERADESATAPYAVFGIEREGQPEFQSDGTYIQGFTIRMAVYSGSGTDPNAAQLGMAAALNTDPTDWDSLRDGRVMHCLPRGYDGRFDPRLRSAKDVFVSGAQWSLLVDGNLGA